MALEKDPNLIKGHFILGRQEVHPFELNNWKNLSTFNELIFSGKALLERDSLDEAIKHLQRASDLSKEQKMNFGDDIAIELRIGEKKILGHNFP